MTRIIPLMISKLQEYFLVINQPYKGTTNYNKAHPDFSNIPEERGG